MNGTILKKEENGTRIKRKNKLKELFRRYISVNGAVKNLRQNLMEQINSVLTNASQRIGFIQELTMKKGFAKNVDANLLSTNTTKKAQN